MVMIKTMGFKWQQKQKTKSLRELKETNKEKKPTNQQTKKEGKVIFRFDFKEIVTTGILI
jgi:hypothetical protein